MIGIFIGLTAGIVMFLLFKKWGKKGDSEFKKPIINCLYAILIAALVWFCVEAIAGIIFHCSVVKTTETTEKVASVNIVALQDNQSLNGRFFLGSGSVNNKNYYAFYYESKNGYKYETLDAKSSSHPVYIKYITSEAETPHVDRYAIIERKIYTGKINPAWFSLITAAAYGNNSAGDILSEEILSPSWYSSKDGYYDNFRYEIVIPEGSVQQNYTIDLE